MKLWHDNIQRPVQGEEALKKFKQVHKNFCEPYRSAAEWIPQGSQCDINQLKYWVPEPWNSTDGRITLAGDAAHAVLPCKPTPTVVDQIRTLTYFQSALKA